MRRLIAALLMTTAALVSGAPVALAHNTLVSSDPANGASVASGPEKVTLTFDQPIQPGFNTITVTGPDNTRWEAGEPTVSSNVVTAGVRPLGPSGEYLVAYRVLSADGHPVTGSVKLTLTQAGTGTPGTPNAAEPADSGAASPVGDAPVWPWMAGAAVLLVAGVVLALRTGASKR